MPRTAFAARVFGLGLSLLAGLAAAQSAPGQFEREFQRDPEPRPLPEPVVPAGADVRAPPGADQVRFVLKAIELDGATAYPPSEIRAAYADLLGTEVSLAQIYDVAAALTRKYRNDGYVLSQVVVPQQAIRDGVVRLQSVEGYIANVRIEGEVLGPRADLEAYAERIRGSRPLRAVDLERYILLVNELAGTTVRATLSPSTTPGASDLTLALTQRRASGAIGISNRGSKSLGPWRADASADVYSLFGAFDRTSLRLIQTLSDRDELTYLSGAYERPIGSDGLKAIVTGSYVASQPGPPQNFNLPTNSVGATATLAYPLRRSRVGNLSVRGTLSYYDGQTDFEDVELTEDRIRALRVGLAWDAIDGWRGVNLADLELSQGLKGLGASPFGSPLASRAGGRPDFTKVTLYAARLQSLAPNWSVLAAVNAQYAFNELLAPEEFAYGGEQFGRAYDLAELLGDSGVAFKIDLRYTVRTPWRLAREIMPYAFYGIGAVYQRSPPPGEPTRSSAANLGGGVRFTGERGLSGYIEVAEPLTKIVTEEGSKRTRVFVAIQLGF
jgi:hemolysin activation/secretion protein